MTRRAPTMFETANAVVLIAVLLSVVPALSVGINTIASLGLLAGFLYVVEVLAVIDDWRREIAAGGAR